MAAGRRGGGAMATLALLLAVVAFCVAPSAAQPGTPPGFMPTPAASSCSKTVSFANTNTKYGACLPLENGASVAWTLNTTANLLSVHFEHSPEKVGGWVAWGISPTGRMPHSSALVAFDTPNGPVIKMYLLPAYKIPALGGNLKVLQQAVEVTNGGMLFKMQFTLQLNQSETQIYQVWGKGPSVKPDLVTLNPHIPGDNFGGLLDLQSGTLATTSNHQSFKNTHGVLNVISWGLMIPFGVFFPRYVRPFTNSLWYYLHMPWQITGYLLGVAGFGTGIQLWYWRTVNYWTHRNLGIAIFVFATLQITAIVLRPAKGSAMRLYWNAYHHTSGYVVVLLSIINVFYGFHVLVTYGNWRTVYIVLISVMAGLALILEAFTWFAYIQRGGRTREQADATQAPMTKASNNGYNGDAATPVA